MAKIYSAPKDIGNPPEITHPFDWNAYVATCAQYTAKVQEWARQNSKDELAGEIIHFPVADGQAQYVVISTKPVALIHLPLGDAYQFQYAHRLTASDIREEVRRSRAMTKLFSKKGA